jgi:para-nitrobenzyl esterase
LTADEQAYFLPETSGQPLTASDYQNWARLIGGQHALDITTRYPVARYGSPSLAEIAAAQDNKRCVVMQLSLLLSRYVPVYAYEFSDRTAPAYIPQRSYPLGAYHTAELQYLFPQFHGARGIVRLLNEPQERIARELTRWWSTFADRGAPGARDQRWPEFRAPTSRVLIIGGDGGAHDEVARASYGAACHFWRLIDAR